MSMCCDGVYFGACRCRCLPLAASVSALQRCCVPASLAIALLLFLSVFAALSGLLLLLRVHGLPIVLQNLSVLLRFVSIFRIGNEVKYLRTSCTARRRLQGATGAGAGQRERIRLQSANRLTCSPGHAYLLISHLDSSQSKCPAVCASQLSPTLCIYPAIRCIVSNSQGQVYLLDIFNNHSKKQTQANKAFIEPSRV